MPRCRFEIGSRADYRFAMPWTARSQEIVGVLGCRKRRLIRKRPKGSKVFSSTVNPSLRTFAWICLQCIKVSWHPASGFDTLARWGVIKRPKQTYKKGKYRQGGDSKALKQANAEEMEGKKEGRAEGVSWLLHAFVFFWLFWFWALGASWLSAFGFCGFIVFQMLHGMVWFWHAWTSNNQPRTRTRAITNKGNKNAILLGGLAKKFLQDTIARHSVEAVWTTGPRMMYVARDAACLIGLTNN